MSNAMRYFSLLLLCLVVQLPIQAQSSTPQALAPILVGPYDGKDVSDNHVVWTWFMQPRASDGSEIICDLKVVEILDGQTPEEALRLNPLLLLKEDLRTSAWQTNFAARNFLSGHRYAWRVIAKVTKNGKEEIVSESEIWTYTYTNTLSPDAKETTNPPTAPSSEEHSQPPAIELKGRARTTLEYADAAGLLSQSPSRLARVQIEPTLRFLGVPFGLNMLLTTEENTRKSDISRGTFGSQNTKKGLNLVLQQRLEDVISDTEKARDSAAIDSLRDFSTTDSLALAQRINTLYELQGKDLSEQLETLKELGVASSEQEIIAEFPAFGFGKVSPQFSHFLFNNVTINGGMLEYNPGNFYAATAIGKIQREVDINGIPQNIIQRDSMLLSSLEFFQNIYSLRMGYGRRNGNNLILTALHSHDDEQSLFLQNILNRPIAFRVDTTILASDGSSRDTVIERSKSNTIVSAQQNTVVGLSSHLSMDSLGVSFDGEFNLSYFHDSENPLWNARDPRVGVRGAQKLEEIFNASGSEHTLVDFNYATRLSWKFLENTAHLSGGLRYVGGGFRSVGVAGVRTDILRADALYNHSFLEKQIHLSAAYTHEEFGYKLSRLNIEDTVNLSTINSYNANAEIRLRSLPIFTLSYSRHQQAFAFKPDSARVAEQQTNSITQAGATTSYLYGTSLNKMASSVSFMWQEGSSHVRNNGSDSLLTTSPGSFRSSTLILSQRVGFGNLLHLGASGSYTTTHASATDTSNVWSVDISLLCLPTEWLSLTAGMVKSRDEAQGTASIGGYCSSRLSVWVPMDIELRVDYRTFRQDNATALGTPLGFQGLAARLLTNLHW